MFETVLESILIFCLSPICANEQQENYQDMFCELNFLLAWPRMENEEKGHCETGLFAGGVASRIYESADKIALTTRPKKLKTNKALPDRNQGELYCSGFRKRVSRTVSPLFLLKTPRKERKKTERKQGKKAKNRKKTERKTEKFGSDTVPATPSAKFPNFLLCFFQRWAGWTQMGSDGFAGKGSKA